MAVRDFVVVQRGADVRARLLLHALELVALARRDDAVKLGLPFGGADLRLLALEPARLAAADLAAGDAGFDARLLIRFGIHEPAAITRPYGLPPATPKERVAVLRQAFLDTFKDPAFLADSEKAKLESDPLSGADLERLIASFFKLDPAILGKLKESLK